MNDFKLIQHHVKAASFLENREKEKKENIDVSVEGGILISKNMSETKYLIVQLKFDLGKSDERLYLTLETESKFEVEKNSDEIREGEVNRNCFPFALSELRKTVKKVTEAYGMTVLGLPPFEEEMENE